VKIALIQMDIKWEAKEANLKKAGRFVKKASDAGCDIAVLPEMFGTGFTMNVRSMAEDENGETASALSGLSKKYAINLIGGFPVKSKAGEKGRNVAFVYNRRGALIAEYSKLHPFSYAGEDKFYKAGEKPTVFKIDGIPSSVFICYDLRFPEAFRAVVKKVRLIFLIANWPLSRAEHWESLLKARAIENQCFVIGVNRVGVDGNNIHYHGGSSIYGPSGGLICRGGRKEELIIADIDAGEVYRTRKDFPFLKDMKF
jgi:predicted amidohydrolase